jgi:hypothetical protein
VRALKPGVFSLAVGVVIAAVGILLPGYLLVNGLQARWGLGAGYYSGPAGNARRARLSKSK